MPRGAFFVFWQQHTRIKMVKNKSALAKDMIAVITSIFSAPFASVSCLDNLWSSSSAMSASSVLVILCSAGGDGGGDNGGKAVRFTVVALFVTFSMTSAAVRFAVSVDVFSILHALAWLLILTGPGSQVSANMSDDHLSEKQRGKRPIRYEDDTRNVVAARAPQTSPTGLSDLHSLSTCDSNLAEVDDKYEPTEVKQISGNKRAARMAGLMGLVNSQDCVDRSDDLQEIDYGFYEDYEELELIKEEYHYCTHKIENCALPG